MAETTIYVNASNVSALAGYHRFKDKRVALFEIIKSQRDDLYDRLIAEYIKTSTSDLAAEFRLAAAETAIDDASSITEQVARLCLTKERNDDAFAEFKKKNPEIVAKVEAAAFVEMSPVEPVNPAPVDPREAPATPSGAVRTEAGASEKEAAPATPNGVARTEAPASVTVDITQYPREIQRGLIMGRGTRRETNAVALLKLQLNVVAGNDYIMYRRLDGIKIGGKVDAWLLDETGARTGIIEIKTRACAPFGRSKLVSYRYDIDQLATYKWLANDKNLTRFYICEHVGNDITLVEFTRNMLDQHWAELAAGLMAAHGDLLKLLGDPAQPWLHRMIEEAHK